MPGLASNTQLPGKVVVCLCGEAFVFARTVRSESGAGGKAMPIDVHPNPDGNVALRLTEAGQLVARVLLKDEAHDPGYEVLGMPHFATCSRRNRKPVD